MCCQPAWPASSFRRYRRLLAGGDAPRLERGHGCVRLGRWRGTDTTVSLVLRNATTKRPSKILVYHMTERPSKFTLYHMFDLDVLRTSVFFALSRTLLLSDSPGSAGTRRGRHGQPPFVAQRSTDVHDPLPRVLGDAAWKITGETAERLLAYGRLRHPIHRSPVCQRVRPVTCTTTPDSAATGGWRVPATPAVRALEESVSRP
jgi:hypothetical protein